MIGKRQHQIVFRLTSAGEIERFGAALFNGRKIGRVAAFRHLDHQFVFLALFPVVARQLRAQTPRLNAHDGIVPRVERRVFTEHLHSHGELFEPVAAAGNRLLDDEAEEAFEPVRLPECLAGEDAIELTESFLVGIFGELWRGALRSHDAMI